VSVDIFVFLALNRTPDFSGWQASLEKLRPGLRFVERTDLATHSGFIPVSVNGKRTGFYFYRGHLADVASSYPGVAAAQLKNGVTFQLSFGGHMDECAAAMRSAEALVKDFGGVAFDPQSGGFMTAQQLDSAAAACEAMTDS
jgi:hypothetical protein